MPDGSLDAFDTRPRLDDLRPLDGLRRLLSHNTETRVDLARRVASLLERAAIGRRSEKELAGGRELLCRGVDRAFTWYSTLTRYRLALLGEALSVVERALGAPPGNGSGDTWNGFDPGNGARAEKPAERQRTAAELSAEARPGETVSTPFLLANPRPHAVTVAFQVDPAREEAGAAELPREWITFRPDPVEIEPRGRAVIEARISVPEQAEPGAVRRTAIRLRGVPSGALLLGLRVLPEG